MSLSRWQPFREMTTLRDTVDRMFDDPFFRQPLAGLGSNRGGLPLELRETEEALIVRAEVPGFEPEQLDISLQGDMLTLRGTLEQKSGEEDEQGNYHLREYRTQSFQRAIRLPSLVEGDAVSAECKNGILTIQLPKRNESQPKRITVQNGQGQKQPEQIEVEANEPS